MSMIVYKGNYVHVYSDNTACQIRQIPMFLVEELHGTKANVSFCVYPGGGSGATTNMPSQTQI